MFLHIKSWNTDNSIEARFEFELTEVVSTQWANNMAES